MTDLGKRNVLGVLVDAVDYSAAQGRVMQAANDRRPYAVSALAVHGVMTGVKDHRHRHRLNSLDLVTPDGQPVRWALNWLHDARLEQRVYGPELMLRLCAAAAEDGLPIYLYGGTAPVLEALRTNLTAQFPGLHVAGADPSRFRRLQPAETGELTQRIRSSGARLVFVGLGCPRQEVFAYELRDAVSMPVVAVGAAFDYHAGSMREPPEWMQARGLQWLYRLAQDPRRLWRRYLLLNPDFLARLVAQKLHLWRPDLHSEPPTDVVGYG